MLSHFSCVCVTYSHMDCSLPGSSVHVIHQAGILEWVARPSFRGSSWATDRTWFSCTVGRFLTTEPPGKPQIFLLLLLSHFSLVRLCVIPQIAAHQAPPSLGFPRQEHWSGLPFPYATALQRTVETQRKDPGAGKKIRQGWERIRRSFTYTESVKE